MEDRRVQNSETKRRLRIARIGAAVFTMIIIIAITLWNCSAIGVIRMISVFDFPAQGGRSIVYRVENPNVYILENGNISKTGHIDFKKYVDLIQNEPELHWQRYRYAPATGIMITIAGSKNEASAFFPTQSTSSSALRTVANYIRSDVRAEALSSTSGYSEAFGRNARLKSVTLRPYDSFCFGCRTAEFTSRGTLILSRIGAKIPAKIKRTSWSYVLTILREQHADKWMSSIGSGVEGAGGLEIAFNSGKNEYVVDVGNIRQADRSLAIGVTKLEQLVITSGGGSF